MLTLEQGAFNESLLDTCWLTIAATDDDEVNQRVSDACEARRIFCNVVDAPKEASFIMPSIIDRSPLMIAVSSGGRSPVLARLLREKLEADPSAPRSLLTVRGLGYRLIVEREEDAP